MARLVKADVLARAGEEGKVIFGIEALPPYLERWQWNRENGQPIAAWAHLERN